MNAPAVLSPPAPTRAVGTSFEQQAAYADEIKDLLFGLLRRIVARRAPGALAAFADPENAGTLAEADLIAALQASGIWFQLAGIAEENAMMRTRRHVERTGGPDQVQGSFANVLASAAALGVAGPDVESALSRLCVGPTLTAHPTEAKRVTVLEAHRRIYRLLFDLEDPRWTARERERLTGQLLNEIELLWLTGELRLERPTVTQEVDWGLHFFRESLFGSASETYSNLRTALVRHFGEDGLYVRPFLRFSSWIGGDRDGNPSVTAAVTKKALQENRAAALGRLIEQVRAVVPLLSISRKIVDAPSGFDRSLEQALEKSGDGAAIRERNSNEKFRQFFSCVLARLEATNGVRNGASAYCGPHDVLADLWQAKAGIGPNGRRIPR